MGLLAFALTAGHALGTGKPPTQTAWAKVVDGPVEVYPKPSVGKKVLARLGSGALVAAFDTKGSGGSEWTKVRVVTPAALEVMAGWTQSSRLEKLPVSRFAADSELEETMGGVYLEDVNARYTRIARYLLGHGQQEPALVCYIGSAFLPSTRLQVFEWSGRKWVRGPYLEFLSSQMQTGVTEIEVRDLVGNGNECLLTREPFAQTFGTRGVNLVIRRLEASGFKTLWQAPIELSNFTSFPPQIVVLDPPEKNIGAPGTVTKATVDYKSNGQVTEPVWQGIIEFHVPGREEPVKTVSAQKVCKWNGQEFAPVQ